VVVIVSIEVLKRFLKKFDGNSCGDENNGVRCIKERGESFWAVAYGVGIIVGAGVYALIGKAAGHAAS
jgi:hypothetical protein